MHRIFGVSVLAIAICGCPCVVMCGESLPKEACSWERVRKGSDWMALNYNGHQLGAWNDKTGVYRPLVGDKFVDEAPCPVNPPYSPKIVDDGDKSFYCSSAVKAAEMAADCRCCGEDCQCGQGRNCGKNDCPCVFKNALVDKDGVLNYGIDRKALANSDHRIVNGKEVSRKKLFEAIEKKFNVDDSKQTSVTVIGSESDRKKVISDLSTAPSLAKFKGHIKVHDYAPDDWAVAQMGYVTSGHPTIYCQSSDGKVLHRQDEYRGPEKLAEALRIADPNYKASSDPDLNKPGVSSALAELKAFAASVPSWAWAMIGGFAVFVYFRRKEMKQ